MSCVSLNGVVDGIYLTCASIKKSIKSLTHAIQVDDCDDNNDIYDAKIDYTDHSIHIYLCTQFTSLFFFFSLSF